MKRSKESKRVWWASDPYLRQVKLFAREDCPSQVASKPQSCFHRERSIPLSNAMQPSDVPPGFGGTRYASVLTGKTSHIPLIKWKTPPRFIINGNWQVAAGEKSEERRTQNLREMKVFEAVYPHRSAIPQRPSVSSDVEAEYYDDSETPLIRLIPVEDEQETAIAYSDMTSQINISLDPLKQSMYIGSSVAESPELLRHNSCPNGQPAPGTIPGPGPDVMVAASAVLAALTRSKEPGSLIDPDLLVKILSDPDMVKKLINNQSPPPRSEIAQAVAASSPGPCLSRTPLATLTQTNLIQPKSSASTFRPHNPFTSEIKKVGRPASSHQFPCMEPVMVSSEQNGKLDNAVMPKQPHSGTMPQPDHLQMPRPQVSATIPMNPIPVRVSAGPNMNPPVKDMNYIKNLIREHGVVNQQTGSHQSHVKNVNTAQNIKLGEIKAKKPKPCMYFNSLKGCKLGSNCLYLHDQSSLQWRTGSELKAPSAKRVKLNGEIAGS